MTWPPSYVRLNSSTLQLCIGMCVGGKCNVYLTPSSLVMTGKSLRDKRALTAATKAAASSRGFTICSTTANTLRMLVLMGANSLVIPGQSNLVNVTQILYVINVAAADWKYEIESLTPERKFHKVLSSTIFKPSHDFGGSGGGGGGGGGGGSGGGVVNKTTCIRAGRDNITAQVKRPPYGSVGGALPTLEAIPPSPLKALPTALRSSDMLLLVENLVSPLMLLLSYSISEQLRSLLLCKASLPTPPELEVVASKALCKGFPDISCNVTPMLMGSATCAAPIPRTPTQPGSKGWSIVMAPVSTFTLNSERSLPPEMEYRNIPLGPSSRSEALTVKIVEPIGSFSGTITW
uniref:Uncharacterized protein n=1 Tax=Glossina pallidipes TaxID=7398 RepID=A0A1A9ZJ47_GLOPL